MRDHRRTGILAVLLLAPVSAELLQAYLGDLGGPVSLIFVVLFFVPLYGGAALLIREISVRTGRGWRGRLLLALAFGIAMPTVIDLSLFTPRRDDIDDWSTIVHAASFLGIGWSAVLTWVGGHVLMSVGAPIVVGETLARRPGPWLGRFGLTGFSLAFLGWAVFIHVDAANSYSTSAGPAAYAVSALLIATPVTLAFTRLGAPSTPRQPIRCPSPWVLGLLGGAGMLALDLCPQSWAGVAQYVTALVVVGGLVGHWSRSPGWSMRHMAALVWAALLARTSTGFLAPLPQDTTWAEKIAQNLTYLLLITALGWALHRRTRRDQSGGATGGSPGGGPSDDGSPLVGFSKGGVPPET